MSIYRGKSAKEFYLASLLYDSIEDQNIKWVQINVVLDVKFLNKIKVGFLRGQLDF